MARHNLKQSGLRTCELFWWLQPDNDFNQRDDLEFLQISVTPTSYMDLTSLISGFFWRTAMPPSGLRLQAQLLSAPSCGYSECTTLPYLEEQLGEQAADAWMEECREQGCAVWPAAVTDPQPQYGAELTGTTLELSLADGLSEPTRLRVRTYSPTHNLRLRGCWQAWSTLGPLLARGIGLVTKQQALSLQRKGMWNY